VGSGRRRFAKSGRQQTRLGLVALLLGLIVVIGITAREPLVRTFPDLAGYYALLGMPVRAGSSFSDSGGIPKSGEQCESAVMRAMEAAHGPSLQSGFA
jgi:hypothetical protein